MNPAFPKLHPRTVNVNRARAVISEAVIKAATEFGLSYPELLYLLTAEAHSYATDALRESRHAEER